MVHDATKVWFDEDAKVGKVSFVPRRIVALVANRKLKSSSQFLCGMRAIGMVSKAPREPLGLNFEMLRIDAAMTFELRS